MRQMQFSLKWFLIVSFALATALGVICLQYKRHNTSRYITFGDPMIKNHNGYYETNEYGEMAYAVVRLPADPQRLHQLNGESEIRRLAITDDAVFRSIDFDAFPNVQRLALTELALQPGDVTRLLPMPNLDYLSVTHFEGAPEAMVAALATLPRLRHLIICSHQIDSHEQIPAFPKLDTLLIGSKSLSDESLTAIQKKMPNIDVDFCHRFMTAGWHDRATLSAVQ